jgi:hypothetical protein
LTRKLSVSLCVFVRRFQSDAAQTPTLFVARAYASAA